LRTSLVVLDIFTKLRLICLESRTQSRLGRVKLSALFPIASLTTRKLLNLLTSRKMLSSSWTIKTISSGQVTNSFGNNERRKQGYSLTNAWRRT
jgi:hypothetical protein